MNVHPTQVETTVTQLPVDRLRRSRLARKLDDAAVRSLMRSIKESGIMQPLRVRPGAEYGDGYEIIFGGHRHEAARRLELETVPCIVCDDDDLDAELAMIDENLCRSELSPAERASATARRKAIYLEKHPETAREATLMRGPNPPIRQIGETGTGSFADETARVTKRSLRSIQRDAERGEKIAPDVLDRIKGTELDTGNFLDHLRRQYDDADEQASFAKQREIVKRGSYEPPEPDPDVVERRQLAKLQAAWNVASDTARTKFLSWLDEKGIAWPSEQKS